jgi:hypothetical protein
MPTLNDIIHQRLSGDKASSSEQQKDEVDKTTQHMKAIKEVKDVAEEISGAGELRKKYDESEKARQKTEAELAKERQNQLQEKIEHLESNMVKLFDQKGPNPEVAKLMQQLESTKNELIHTRFDYLDKQIKELGQMKDSGASQTALDQQIKQIKAAASELGLQPPSGTTMSPELQVQIKQMDINLQLQMEQMKDERDRRDKEWQLTVRKWDEEKEQRERELTAKVAVEREKMEMVGDFVKKVGATFAQATTAAGQEMAPGRLASQAIEAGEGDFGEISCPTPGCGSTIAVAKDAIKAVCPSCQTVYPIHRIPKEPEVESEVES